MLDNQKTFDATPCYVELLGHNKVACKVSESFGGLLKLEIPETQNNIAFTQFINVSSLYRITPITEELMVKMAEKFSIKPIDGWDIREYYKKLNILPEAIIENNEDADEEYEDADEDSLF